MPGQPEWAGEAASVQDLFFRQGASDMSHSEKLRKALAEIAAIASAAVSDRLQSDGQVDPDRPVADSPIETPTCTPKALPKKLWGLAAKTAVEINPVNAPMFGPLAEVAADFILDPQRIAVLTAKYWGSSPRRLTVSFMESTPADLRSRIIAHMNAWMRTACIQFVATQGTGDVRISRGSGGYYSYLGTDILHIPRNRQTMNLEAFTMKTPESEFKRVIRHETGHTLGFPHEHMRRELVARIDPQKAYEYFRRTQGWDRQTVDQQVLTPLGENTIFGTPSDQTSIMCYQLPGSITRDGRAIVGGLDINATDYSFAGRIYPLPGHQPVTEQAEAVSDEEWDAEFATT
jgi:hypothetical protein